MHTLNLACQSINLSEFSICYVHEQPPPAANSRTEATPKKIFHSPNTQNENLYYFLIKVSVMVVQTYLTQEIQWQT